MNDNALWSCFWIGFFLCVGSCTVSDNLTKRRPISNPSVECIKAGGQWINSFAAHCEQRP